MNMLSAMTRRQLMMLCMLALLPLSFLVALAFGTIAIPIGDTLAILLGQDDNSRSSLVIEQIRLPRAILAAFVGGLLGITGATTQGLFRNALADPSLIGVTAGASAGAAIAIFGAAELIVLQGFAGLGVVSLGAFIGGSFAVIVVYMLATDRHGTSVATMLLAGIAITAIAASLTSLLEFFGDDEMLRRISLWRMGGLDGANYQRVSIVALFGITIFVLLPRYATALNALLLGESEARHLGLSVQRIKIQLILLVAVGVGISVALAGTIAFIGLVVPHIIRLLIGPDHRYLLPCSAVGGAILLLLSDTVARTVLAPIELPVGLVTALLGAPFFISLLRHRHHFGVR
ncbi:FecCD family ABC transporter permease [Arenicella xantha]|uniref:Iron complex transport system permease protein n=1 Tax=Arenicella xantha TaxID=644221 RepID=A0A395JFQ5_9GAMM|nr:iron ABC transporter permease [Arenicella xantha]RBP48590.1 iron complex transport system permease protein [Arenicella xantha]